MGSTASAGRMSPSPSAGRLDRRDVEAPRERRQAPQQGALLVAEQLVAPVERPSQGLLALGQVAGAGRVEADRRVPAREHGRGRQDRGARSRELDRQRQAVQAPADLRHGDGDLRGQLELRIARAGSRGEQRHRRAASRPRGIALARVGQRQRRQREHVLGREAERRGGSSPARSRPDTPAAALPRRRRPPRDARSCRAAAALAARPGRRSRRSAPSRWATDAPRPPRRRSRRPRAPRPPAARARREPPAPRGPARRCRPPRRRRASSPRPPAR